EAGGGAPAGQGAAEPLELVPQLLELALRQVMAEAPRAAVRQEGDVTVAQPERRRQVRGRRGSRSARRRPVRPRRQRGTEPHHLALAEVIAAAVGAELGDLLGEGGEAAALAQLRQPPCQGLRRAVVAKVTPVLAARPPFGGDAESGAD